MSDVREKLNSIASIKDHLKQVATAKEVGRILKETKCTETIKYATTKFSEIYISVEQRHPLKKTIASMLQSLEGSAVNDDVVCTLAHHLAKNIDNYKITNTNFALKQAVENLASCLDCFLVGTKAVGNIQGEVWIFVVTSLESLKKQLSDCPSPLETTELYNLCQQVLKVFSLSLQEFGSNINALQTKKSNVYSLIVWLLMDEFTVLNCRLSSGIALANLLKVDLQDKLFLTVKKIERGEYPLIPVSEFSYVSTLCFWGGLLASLSASELVEWNGHGRSLLVESLFPKICAGTQSKEDSGIFLAQCRMLYLWTEKACDVLELSKKDTCTCQEVGNEKIVHSLLQFVWAVWEHSADGVRYHGRGIFKNAVRIQLLSNADDGENFLSSMTLHLLDLPWHCKGKYGALSHLVELVGCTKLLRLKSLIVSDLIEALLEGSLAPHVSELMESFSIKHKTECSVEVWEDIWLKPLVLTISEGTKVQRNGILQYVLPKLLKISPKSVHYITKMLVPTDSRTNDNSLCAMIMCIKAARACRIKFEKSQSVDGVELWKDCLPFGMLKSALFHTDEQVRLDALGLICDSPRTSEEISLKELDLLHIFIQFNTNIQSPSFRQKALSHLKKVLLRMRDSSHLLLKKKEQARSSDDHDTLDNYRSFLIWLINFLFSSLHPEANFPRRGTVLHLLALLKEIFGFCYTGSTDRVNDSDLGACLEISSSHCQTLLKFTRDTYENNKELVLALLSDAPGQHLDLKNIKKCQELMDVSLQLASSSRPPDSVTAAYLLRLLVKQKYVCEDAFTAHESLRNQNVPSEIASQSYFYVLSILLRRLQKELAVAYESLLDAAANGPMYGVLVAIRMLLSDAQLNTSMSKQDEEAWSALLEKIVKVSLQVTTTVQPVVCNASPEGHLPMDADMSSVSMLQEAIKKAIGRRFDLAVVLEEKDIANSNEERVQVDLVKTRAVTAQMLLLCSWRAHKEVSLLLGDICENIVLFRPECTRLLSSRQITQMGNFFIQQLSEIKHRGAFEQAYIGFCKLCKGLWRSTDSLLHQLPQQWLKDLLTSITIVDSEDVSCCPTRRSAGVPFFVQALLVTEPDVMSSRCFKEAMDSLLKLSVPDEEYTKTQVHALNILRALYKDAHLGEEVTPYVSQGLQAAILGFKSEMWSVRNSATLLFTTLMTRIFGVNRSREDPHKKNCLTGRVFFLRFPAVFDFLLSELKSSVEGIEMCQQVQSDSLHSNLYPILLLLSRLYPSPIEGSDSLLQLGAFIPLVDSCSCSAIWWTRQLAARALVPLLPAETQPQYLESLFRRLSCCVEGMLPQNVIHGRLLQILNIMNDMTNSTKTNIEKDFSNWLDSCKYLLTSENPCAITRSAFLDIIACALNFEFKLPDGLRQLLLDQFRHINKSTQLSVVFEEQYKMLLARTGLLVVLSDLESTDTFSLEHALVDLLRTESYEVRSLCLDFLSWLLEIEDEDDFEGRSLDSVPLGRRHSWKAPMQRKIHLRIETLNSVSLLQQLLLMILETEKHAWCRAETYHVLGAFQRACTEDWKLSKGLILDNAKKMVKVIEELENTEFEDVAIAALHFSGRLALAIYHEGQEYGQISPEKQAILGRWMICVLSAASASSSVQKRSATAKVLLSAEVLIADERAILSALNLPLWDAAIILLQDDEPLIRDIICRGRFIMHQRVSGDASETVMRHPVISSLYLKTLIGGFSSRFIQSYPEHGITMLADWSLRCDFDISPNQNDEQPFNKGEMNVFAEEITLTDLAIDQLDFCLGASSVSNFSKMSLTKLEWSCNVGLEEFTDCQNLAELSRRCFEKSQLLAEELTKCGHREVFLTHRVDTLALKLYQRIRLFETVFRHDWSIAINVSDVENLGNKLRKWPYVDNFTRGISDRLQSLVCVARKSHR